jgi:Histidine phosphatase superfamily (branch 1)
MMLLLVMMTIEYFIFLPQTTQLYWPMVAFDDSMTEDDELWKPDQRETLEMVHERILDFMAWLVQQPQNHVVVVTHGVFMECCLEYLCQGCLEGKRVYNCDAYASECQSSHGAFVSLHSVRHIETAAGGPGGGGGGGA